ncbi:TolC family outer membrane protein [Parvularcula maris]|uniref:TolC family outer membrane protein n=1 Tax=Parvularcula maris TaxID=2965077 RepID=A0A9X2LA53_9PROT|nr:TolC family outer membrane protein [Parvularcula maris]MCQ8185963.1 TolC family outer membrane protein [Parvularcula maris]
MRKLAVILLACSSANAQTDPLLLRLTDGSPELAAAKAEAGAARAEVWEARGAALPQLSVTGQFGTVEETFTVQGAPGSFAATREPSAVSASIQQTLFASGRVMGGIRAAKASARQSEEEAEAVRQDLLLAGALLMAKLVRDRAVLEERSENARLTEGRLSEASARRRAGLATLTDERQSEARLALARAEVEAARAQLDAQEAAFARLFGFAAPRELTMPSLSTPLPGELEEALNLALRQHPSLGAARERQEAARQAVRAARGATLPQVSLNAEASSADEQRFGIELGEAEVYSLTVQGRWDLFSGGSGYARTRAAGQRRRAAGYLRDAEERRVREGVQASWSRLIAARASLMAREAQVRAASLAAEGVAAELTAGRRTRLDLLDADRERTEAEVALLSAKADVTAAEHALLHAVGGL